MKNLKSTKITEIVNVHTGEVVEQTTEKTFYEKVNSEEHFFMTYIDFVAPWYQLKSELAKNLLLEMCIRAEGNKGIVLITSEIRSEIMEKLGIKSAQSFSNCIKLLRDSNLISGERGTFKINPQIFGKGDKESRKALLNDSEIQLTFSIVKKDLKTKEFESNEFDK